jgi:hypothetical protein
LQETIEQLPQRRLPILLCGDFGISGLEDVGDLALFVEGRN